jgi:uncharacterized coiled-coil DUF342 family protein
MQAMPLRNQRDILNDEAWRWIEKRNQLNEEARRLREEATKLKNRRDDLNHKVMELKKLRDKAKSYLELKLTEASKIKENLKLLQKRVSKKENAVRQQIQALDWKLQTTLLTPSEERKLVSQVKTLETQLAIYEQLRKIKRRLIEYYGEIEAAKSQIKSLYEQLSGYAQESQVCHAKMMGLLQQADVVKLEADKAHKAFLEIKQRADKFHQAYVKVVAQVEDVELQIKQINAGIQLEQIRKAKEARNELSKVVSEKLKRGEKITFEEFKLLMEEGNI